MAKQIYDTRFGDDPAENYENFFVRYIGGPLARRFIAVAAPREGERALDVACGTGVVTRLLAERVGASGSVAGLDVNPAMLSQARKVAPAIAWHESSAEAMPLPDGAFDLVTCQMGLQFIPNKLAALREMKRVLAPNGRLVLGVPGPTPPLFGVIADALARHVSSEVAGFCHIVFSVHDADELRDLALSAGFGDARVDAETPSLKLPPPAEFFWGYFACTPLAPMIADLDDARRSALERDVVEGLQRFVIDGDLTLAVRMSDMTATTQPV